MGQNNLVGAWGEATAAAYLQKKRYTLEAVGFRCRYGEIDLIVRNRKYLVFVEVKLRKSDTFAQALEYVDRIIGIKAGKIVYDGKASDIDNEVLKEIYGGDLDKVGSSEDLLKRE